MAKKTKKDEEVKVTKTPEEVTETPEEVTETPEEVTEKLPKIEDTKVDALIDVKADTVIILRATKVMKPSDFEALKRRVAEVAKENELKLIVIPNSAKVETVEN